MKTGARLQLKLGQKLKLAPQLRQAIALLQLNRIELRQHIREALDTNPLLERADDSSLEAPEDRDSTETDVEVELTEDYGFDDLPDGYSVTGPAPNYDEFISDRADESLQQHLLWQVNLAHFSPTDEAIARAIVYALDEEGYLRDDLATLRASLAPEYLVGADEVAAVIERVQHFEPVGVASRSVGECLLVQLRTMPSGTPSLGLACHLVEHYLDELGRQDMTALTRATGVEQSEIQAALEVIRRCNPHPCSRFSRDDEHYIVPDVFIHPSENGWQVSLNPDNEPGLRLNDMYVRLTRKSQGEDKKYLNERLQEARWLISGLEMRNQTLLSVTHAIVEAQHAFFSEGETAMRPLLQRQVAERVGVHESTVSRATTGKYAHTPRGTFELKHFFSVGIDTSDGRQVAATAVKARLRKLIGGEDASRPLSDQALADQLADSGIMLARRTVAKYREQLGIPGSAQRRRAAQLQSA
ncbi:MAG: RNA polymerase factor sigma-54 [Pseudomonadota bacterium]|nr:MAG: RNA polymerase factor sigma-54 [Pseudomonadota bacterium]